MNFVKFRINDMRKDDYVFVNLDNVAIIRESNLGYVIYFENKRVSILNNEENNKILSDLVINED